MRLHILLLSGLAAAAMLSGCSHAVQAPPDDNVCYFIGHPNGADGKPTLKFNPISKNEPDLEHCAKTLYLARMNMLQTNTAGEMTEGVYNGNFLFVTNRRVDFSQHYEGPLFPLLIKDPYSDRLVQPGAVMVEDTPDDKDSHTVDIPKDLPKTGATTTPPQPQATDASK